MDNHESEQLDEIQSEVAGSNAQLGAIAERTRSIQDSLDTIDGRVEQNQDDIDELQSDVKRNSVIINAVTVGLGSAVIWLSDKLTRIIP